MTDKPINAQALDVLERKLWDIIAQRSLTDETPPPRLESLLAPESCEAFAEDLHAYALARAHGHAASWQDHPLLRHLTQCDACQQQLEDLTRLYSQSPYTKRQEADLDITLLYEHLPLHEERGTRSTKQTGPRLLAAGFLEKPRGWFFSLEQLAPEEDKPAGLLFSLVSPQGEVAHIEARVVLLGRILHGITDKRGKIFFPNILIPHLDAPLVPAINVRLTLPA